MDDKNSKIIKATPGWNDPPMLDHGVRSVSTNKSRLGNKRVPFPLTDSSHKSQQPLITIPTAAHTTQLKENVKNSPDGDNDLFCKTVDNFDRLLSEKCCDPKFNEIKIKLDTMKTMWNEGKLTDDIQSHLYELSEFLLKKNHDEANKLHLKLVMEHSTLCSPWIVGIKHLIHMIR